MSYVLSSDTRYCISHSGHLEHHGRKGQRWGVLNGPPYPLDKRALANSQYGGLKSFAIRKNIDRKTGLRLKTKEYSQNEDLAACNPGKGKPGYSNMNCGYCVTAYDLRRRGYDVYAGDPGTKGTNALTFSKFYNGLNATSSKHYFYKTDAEVPQFATEENSRNIEAWLEKTLSEQEDGSRGFIGISFTPYIGHAMAYEVKNGEISILDPQNNDRYTAKEISDVSVDACVFRLDDKEPNYKYLRKNGVVRNV